MKKLILPSILALFTIQAQAQDVFALVGQDSKRIIFQDFRALDLNRGVSGEVVYGANSTNEVVSQTLNSRIQETKASYHNAQATQMATLAYNASGNLVYNPMFSSNIYVLNVRTKQLNLIENEVVASKACDVNSHLTRMATGKDGNVYAITNSGSQFIKISESNGLYSVENLGAIQDVSNNKEISFTAMNTGFGGDMIGDGENNFYVFSASRNVFKVNTKSLTAEYVGTVSGLPEGFTLNGSAVTKEGKIVVGSAKAEGLFEMNLDEWVARPVSGEFAIPVYDLASNYFVNDKGTSENVLLTGVSIYPTKVNEQVFNVKVNNENIKGNLNVEVIDYLGNKLVKQTIKSVRQNTEYNVRLNGLNQGAYIVNIAGNNGETLLSEKIMVTR